MVSHDVSWRSCCGDRMRSVKLVKLRPQRLRFFWQQADQAHYVERMVRMRCSWVMQTFFFNIKVSRPEFIHRKYLSSLVYVYTIASAVWTGWEWRNRLWGFFPCWPRYEALMQKKQWLHGKAEFSDWSHNMHCCITFSGSPCFPDPFIQLVTYVKGRSKLLLQ